jgi:transcriptional/translational regulatory protein YebC/TACO1
LQHIKAEKDGEKAALFTKYARQIRIAMQEGGSANPALNSKLAAAIEEAKNRDMPLATINKNIEKYKNQQVELKQLQMEVKCCNRIFLIANFYTENLVILKSNFNTIFRKEAKSVQSNAKHLFDEIGIIQISLPNTDIKTPEAFEDKITEDAIECDAQEVEECDFASKNATLICNPLHLYKVKSDLTKRGYVIEYSEITFVPHNTIELTDEERKHYESLLKRIGTLEGLDKVYDNVQKE